MEIFNLLFNIISNSLGPINQIAQVSSMLQSMVAAAERVFEFLEEKEEVEDVQNPKSTENLKGNVTFDHVQFGYDEDRIIINDFSADVKDGQKIAIVGPTGAGKTTMVTLLMRFYDVNKGASLVDGINIKDFKREDLRKMFGMVLQDTWLFGGTIKDNIKYSKPDATDAEVIEAAKAAHVHHFIKTLPKAYDMVLNGYELGGGSVRISDEEVQEKMFKALGMSQETANDKFGYLLEAFKYGVPPHAGLAFGFDRLMMLLTGADNIREVIAFPKNQNAICPMTNAPGLPEDGQLEELSIKLELEEQE